MRKALPISLLFAFGLQKSTGQSHKQTTTLYQATVSSTISVTFGAAVTAGNLIVVHIDWDNQARSIVSVVDNKGNTYKKINGPTNWNGANYRAELWYTYNVAGGAGFKVTATLTGAPASFTQIYTSEYSGIPTSIDPLDQNAVAANNTAAASSGAKTTTYSNELIYGASIGASGALTTGAGFTTRSSANQNIIEDKNVAVIGSFNASFTSAGGNWVAQMATFISTNSILPATLSSFTGRCTAGSVILDWTTTMETNSDWFTLEGSIDGNNWIDIRSVSAAGNSSVGQRYSCSVDQSRQSFSFYRLKQTDLDGRFYYSSVIRVGDCGISKTGITLFPNPSTGNLLSGTITAPAGGILKIEIFDQKGKMIHRASVSTGPFQLDFGTTLAEGIYYARVVSPECSSTAAFIVKH
jgi:hypothetical protein